MSEFKYIDVDNEEQEITTDTHTQNHNTVLTTKQLASYGRWERAQKIMQYWMGKGEGKSPLL